MKGRAEYKVPGGKLVRADVSFGEEVEDVELHGDFFVYPEEALEEVEESLEGLGLKFDPEEASERILSSLGEAELVGFGPGDIVKVVQEAMEDD